ncbi:hypothetical protein PG985_013625 [Apiospora marii]|uniref:Rhodopsin domain-containing protein n=1 Tax=Apiospora marii TaxID=335849 RepID=A0ABR1R7G6_9PEZI
MGFDKGYWSTPEHVITAAIGLAVLDIAFLTLRFLSRRKQRQPLKTDDWILIPAIEFYTELQLQLFTLGISISMVYGVSRKTIGYPYVIPPEAKGNALLVTTEQISLAGQIQWTFYLLLPLALGCTKMSFLFFYKRVFAIERTGATNILLIGMIVLITMWMTGFFLTTLFQCKLYPSAAWVSPMAQLQHCISQPKVALALTITDFMTDIAIISIPIPLIWRLHLKPAKKFAVTGVFLLGAVTVAVSLLRLIFTERLARYGFDPNTDAILLITSIQYWGIVESGVAVFAACLPTLGVLLKGWSWDPLANLARSLLSYSDSSRRRLRTKSSRRSTPATDSLDRDSIRLSAYRYSASEQQAKEELREDNISLATRSIP